MKGKVGIILGAIIGAGLGILFAPHSGKKTRAWLYNQGAGNRDLLNETKDAADILIQKTRESINESLDKLSQTIEKQNTEKDFEKDDVIEEGSDD